MAGINQATKLPTIHTHEGAKADRINAVGQLRRTVMACMLWENNFYEDGQSIAERIKTLVHQVSLADAAVIAIEARAQMKLRHVPLLIVREMARHPKRTTPAIHTGREHNHYNTRIISETLAAIIQRADELSEFLAIYWKDGKCPLSKQVKLGLAKAFQKFSEYDLAKYNRKKDIMLRDVLFLCHSKPADAIGGWTKTERALYKPIAANFGTGVNELNRTAADRRTKHFTDSEVLYEKLVNDQLETPDTWEVALSGGADKKATFERLMTENQLGDLAFLRNLRNMTQAGVETKTLADYGANRRWGRVLPFRFIAAARVVPQLEPLLETWMFNCLEGAPRLPGKTILLCDVSSSMRATLSAKSDLTREDAMRALAMLLREICEEVLIVPFAQEALTAVAPRRGFALADIITRGRNSDGTRVGAAVTSMLRHPHDRMIVITDEQSADRVPAPFAKNAYFINVANNKNGIGYGPWTHIDGFSEAVVDYIVKHEASEC